MHPWPKIELRVTPDINRYFFCSSGFWPSFDISYKYFDGNFDVAWTRIDDRAFEIIVQSKMNRATSACFSCNKGVCARGVQRCGIKINCNHKILDARILFLSPRTPVVKSRWVYAEGRVESRERNGSPFPMVSLVNRGRVNRWPSVNRSCRYEKR